MSGIYDLIFGGGAGGSMMSQAKQGMGLQSILADMFGGGSQQYDKPIGPQQGTGQPMPSSVIDPATQGNSGGLAALGRGLSTFGAGMAKASGPSRMPVSFGEVLAGGNDAMQAADDKRLETRYKEAQIRALGNKGVDLEKTAQQALVKSNMGIELTPQERASLQAYDTMNQAKLSYTQDKMGNFIPQPAARSIMPQSGGQAVRPPLSSFMR